MPMPIPGYAYGTPEAARSPITGEELEKLKAGWGSPPRTNAICAGLATS